MLYVKISIYSFITDMNKNRADQICKINYIETDIQN